MVTIYDIAKLAGCSPATVSKAFNNYSSVKDSTYKKIMEVSESLSYTPNTNARALTTKKTWLIGVIFSEDTGAGITHPHFGEILQNFKMRAAEYGYDVLFVSKHIGNKEASYLEHCKYRGLEGVLLAMDRNHADEIQNVLSSDVKCVSVEDIYPNTHTVIADYRMGTMQALEYLYLLGHRKIAHVACPLTSVAGRERYGAYLEFLNSKGIEFNPKYIIETDAFAPEEGSKAAVKLLQQCWDDLPTAIFMAYDDIAFSAISTIQSQGFRVPEDISVVGFDNLKVSGYMSPALTTVHQDRATIGQKAADKLIQLIENKPMEDALEVRIPTKLIVRNSCTRV
ncbi:LacI family transcriptional regulator [Clostridium swellfunianum]|uniref:LacI family DNA-binding transcriptional regulator n=1 Tax=Clostridium swellfunianum TaxID=1367462 RepID=UPI002030FFC4|nr:LacI family DNA-binding transcriptional regulator [Clostridium swellfunianum]MCM0648131.1 LacI family transcriptional regulator [Clostridium swellfunianum]